MKIRPKFKWIFKGETNKSTITIPDSLIKLQQKPSDVGFNADLVSVHFLVENNKGARNLISCMKITEICFLKLYDYTTASRKIVEEWELAGIKISYQHVKPVDAGFNVGFDLFYSEYRYRGEDPLVLHRNRIKNYWLN